MALLLATSIAGSARADVGVLAVARGDAPVSAAAARSAVAAVIGAGATETPLARARAGLVAEVLAPERRRDLARAETLLREGWRSYAEARPSFAAARLAEARTVALSVADTARGRALLAEISLRLGATKVDLGRRAEAADDFRLAARLAPERVVADTEFKPEVVAAFAAAGATGATGAVQVDSGEPGVALSVSIDGDAPARAPVERAVGDGLHLVVARAPGRRPLAQLVSVAAGGRAELSPALEVDRLRRALAVEAPLAVGTGEDRAADAVQAALVYGQLEAVALVAPVWRRGAPALLVQVCSGDAGLCGRVVEIGFPGERALAAAAREGLARARLGERALPPTLTVDARLTAGELPPGTAGPAEGDGRWWKSGWLWAGVGAAVLGAAAFAVLSRDEPIQPVILGDACQFRPCP